MQPLSNIFFGDLTQSVVNYGIYCFNPSSPYCTDKVKEDLMSGIRDFALWNTVIGVVIFITSYLAAETFNYTAIKQVYLYFSQIVIFPQATN